MKLTFLGTGTSHGVPVIGCDCEVCTSSNPLDKRNRCSVYVEPEDGKKILIDIGPEFRIQAIENKVKKVDALLLTHSHADHLHGIDDLRIFSADMFKKPDHAKSLEQFNAPPIPVYTNKQTMDDIEVRFAYFFKHSVEGGGHAKVTLNLADQKFTYGATEITPIPMLHGHLETTGWLLTETDSNGEKKSIAYLTDCSFISEESFELIRKNCGILKHLIIDGLRIKPHSTHFSFEQAMEAAEKLPAENVWFTHITHQTSHKQVQDYINENLSRFPKLTRNTKPAYDKLIITT
ncbi:MAG: MBL fold metallo-hydrolase [Treponema sp.]|nr:MBL fold metallo-hydrolase [Treponema sp.]